jgi:iron complex outermembrane receptor protein
VLCAACVYAGEPDDLEVDEEVPVTAPRVADPTIYATVLDVTHSPTRVDTLADALGSSVGVRVRRFGGMGDFATASIRGFSPGQVQVYFDGVPLSRSDGEVVNLSELPLDLVERVEVYRGQTPLGFSQSGPGGIINVVPRTPGEGLTAASASYGSLETRKVDVAHAGQKGRWSWLGFLHYFGTKGDFTYPSDNGTPENPNDDEIVTRINNASNLGDLTARVAYQLADRLQLRLTSDTFGREEGVPGLGNVQAENTSLSTVRQLAHLDLDLDPKPGLPLEANAGVYMRFQNENFDDRFGEIFVPEIVDTKTLLGGGQVLVRGSLWDVLRPGAFVALGHERFDQTNELAPDLSPPGRSRLRTTLAGETELLPWGDRISLVGSVRWEGFRDELEAGPASTRDFTSPRGSFRVSPWPWVSVRGNLGQYARMPSLTELFGTSGVFRGNPDLQPEIASNRDIGIALEGGPWRVLDHVGFEFVYFDNHIEDLILLVQKGQRIVQPVNVGEASVTGEEVSLATAWWNRVGWSVNYTHLDARDESDVTFRRGKELPSLPSNQAFMHFDLTWGPLRPLPVGKWAARAWPGRLFYDLDFIGANFLDQANLREVPSRIRHRVGIQLALPVRGLEITFEVHNAGNNQTRDLLNFPVPGRTFYGTLSWGFGTLDQQRGEPSDDEQAVDHP